MPSSVIWNSFIRTRNNHNHTISFNLFHGCNVIAYMQRKAINSQEIHKLAKKLRSFLFSMFQSASKVSSVMYSADATSSNSAEPVRSESWSEWAWSWLPTWMDKEGGVEEATLPPTPIPIFFTAYFDHISLVFKVRSSWDSRLLRILRNSATAKGLIKAFLIGGMLLDSVSI